ncbi:hypothetical protein FACS1894217_05650 [Clostridia bacterium]|nr:hypothetical protein FACS1894217_05650 [Clostridia bacterium]
MSVVGKFDGLSKVFAPEVLNKSESPASTLMTAPHKREETAQIPLERLIPYQKEHPFKAYGDDEMASLVESIKENGVLTPLLVRRADEDAFDATFEILAGHNRAEAAKRAGLDTVLCRILDVDDDRAALVVVETNLEQRENLLPSEKAFAYKLRLDAMRRHGGDTREAVADDESARTVSNYIRLTYLDKDLLQLVDDGELSVMSGVYVSFLPAGLQEELYRVLVDLKLKLSVESAKRLKELHDSGDLSASGVRGALTKPKKEQAVSAVFAKTFGKYIKKATKKRKLTAEQSNDLMARIQSVTDEFLSGI